MPNGNPFYVEPASLQGLGQIAKQYRLGQEKEEQATALATKQQEAQDVLASGDVSLMANFMAANPQIAQSLEASFQFKDDATRKNMADSAFRILQGEDKDTVIRDRAAFISQQGGSPAQTLEGLDDTPEETMQSAKIMLAQYGTPEQIKAVSDLGLAGVDKKAMTPYQTERLKLDKKGLEIREVESRLRQEDNVNKRKSLENRVKKESLQLDKLERELAADQKGGAAQKMLRGASESEKKASSFARRMSDSASTLLQLESTMDPTSRVIGIISGGKGITSEAANRLASAEEQAYASAASDFVTAQLRQESGAAIGQNEFDRKYREFFPVPGDSPIQIELKRERRKAASEDMKILSGGLYDELYGEQTQQAAQQTTQGIPVSGDVSGGYRFKGGDPSLEKSWEAI